MMQITKPVSFENVVSMEDLSTDDVLSFIHEAQDFKAGKQIELKRPVYAANLFFESSTRTHTSFEMAERKLGLQVVNFDPSNSSLSKGESMSDTVKTFQAIGVDLVAIRDRKNEYYKDLIADPNIHVGIANGGDGSGQHPSQSLLDMMTIYEEFGHFEGLKVAIVGDLTHSRVARSNMEVLTMLGAHVYFGGPKKWYTKEFAKYGEWMPIDDLVENMDVMMFLRVQHERIADDENGAFSAEKYHEQYGLTAERESRMPQRSIIMHPAPVNRGVEIADELVECDKSRIFQQMHNGVFIRMALMTSMLRNRDLIKEEY
ncbi:aspartate carbamoyltransferase catalytic subunit [Lentilactobacillus kefiri]|uniref:Aspartate carbamoyltransferase n=2 Tax=Lentilactobacillus kefiri TaxID=33962 RepID=A0A8E1UZH2_LENKE|nr:aspartate carbamoyltransferase catalytic subunit [Lentilactobacillus kefiri]KRL73469.1 aspartate carbamoyltransferase [Lentilactobacillus parakefiri DSM 10551]KRM49672.1 aspartate carbamoyltransferase [Lentilactobacillus kefiri DSM 20587 = JCM 5818]MCJ2162464.1 aspartate carbamoyltransferase catalytic subunit [Lentilactobacillus kefiri]MCP9369694.1 aspartate carbamoyltransferase catalytic subunit [Lentilactobacillus kefiri]MDH5109619.1 aspartate carbamoyltransferase catalytic subunit [Lenti